MNDSTGKRLDLGAFNRQRQVSTEILKVLVLVVPLPLLRRDMLDWVGSIPSLRLRGHPLLPLLIRPPPHCRPAASQVKILHAMEMKANSRQFEPPPIVTTPPSRRQSIPRRFDKKRLQGSRAAAPCSDIGWFPNLKLQLAQLSSVTVPIIASIAPLAPSTNLAIMAWTDVVGFSPSSPSVFGMALRSLKLG